MDNKIHIQKLGDYYLQNLTLAESKFKDYQLGRYGRMRLNYLKHHRKAEYITLFMNNKLDDHLYNIDTECQNQFEFLMKQFAEKENITEELKSNSQMKWVQKMNSIRSSVDERQYFLSILNLLFLMFLYFYTSLEQNSIFLLLLPKG